MRCFLKTEIRVNTIPSNRTIVSTPKYFGIKVLVSRASGRCHKDGVAPQHLSQGDDDWHAARRLSVAATKSPEPALSHSPGHASHLPDCQAVARQFARRAVGASHSKK